MVLYVDMMIKVMRIEDAKEISTWVYEEPYSLYSMDSSQETIEELMNGTYFSVYSDKSLIGYFCYGQSAQVPGGRTEGLYNDKDYMDIGLGLRPDITGKGIGKEFVLKGMEFGINKYNPKAVRLTVAMFNKRAIRVYEKVGFTREASFINKRGAEERQFIIMARSL